METVKFSRFNFIEKTGSIKSETLRHLLGISQLDRERNQSVGDKLGVQDIVRETEQY
jgi:hypothetical protein